MPSLEDVGTFDFSNENEDDDAVAKHKQFGYNNPNGYQSAFLYGKIEEEVYVCQPLGFKDLDFPDRVYKVEKHYMDYIKLLEPVNVDDIIFGSTRKELCNAFERLTHEKFQMSLIGELTFFLGLQVKQKNDGIFISQDKYQVNSKVSRLHAVKRIF
nr:hypothetical protein [Tanacetum cinerariifolium]